MTRIIFRISCSLISLAILMAWQSWESFAQSRSLQSRPPFSRSDSLRGTNGPLRTCYDVTFYHLEVRIDPSSETITGSNTIYFRVVDDFREMQIDLFENMGIEAIMLDGSRPARFTREYNAVIIRLPEKVSKGSLHTVSVSYGGKPTVARRPPWDGGLTWEKDKNGNPWVAVTCQGTGASLWWPTKDHQADEPDSMLLSVTVPPGLDNISNGRLRGKAVLKDGWTTFDWFISYPINNYNVTINIGKFAHFSDTHIDGDTLTLDYYVMPENLDSAKKVFGQVKPMMKCFEKYFGKYPFPRDGFKLIESPHTGMEHQSAVAYGNRYLGGYRGRAPSEAGLKFDFIIIHESAHEWWGNSVTSKDIADMWIHESFGAYAEALYVECQYGREESLKYINGKKSGVLNDRPMIGMYDVQYRGSGDMYNKGQLVLNTLRSVLDNDALWFSIVRGIAETFKYQTITADSIFQFIDRTSGRDLGYFYEQYFKRTNIPTLVVQTTKKGSTVTARFRWETDVQGFRMPVKALVSPGEFEWIYPTTEWQTLELKGLAPEEFKVDENLFYVNVRTGWSYVDPRLRD